IAQKGEKMKFRKTPEWLINFFQPSKEAIMCNYCLYKTDLDPEYINFPDYLLKKKDFKSIKQFQKLNNKFINRIKAAIGFLLNSSGASFLAIKTLASVGLMVRYETIARQKAQYIEVYMETNKNLVALNMNYFYNIYKYHCSDTTTTHDISHFVIILLKALPKIASVPFKNPNQEKSIYNKKGIYSDINYYREC
ncbi:23205_t:CDS:2, partial [Gigaspora rosea]